MTQPDMPFREEDFADEFMSDPYGYPPRVDIGEAAAIANARLKEMSECKEHRISFNRQHVAISDPPDFNYYYCSFCGKKLILIATEG